MSGICGIINRDGKPVDQQLLTELTNYMAFRGPDAQQIWADGPVGLGHTLLRTTFEAEHEQQPCSLDGRIWITADARIDGQESLKSKLQGKGRNGLAGITDAELILHAYYIWGQECLQHLLGDFAFAIWDGPRQQLFCARDHFGVKPFYYAHQGHTFIFSNTLNCIRQHPAVSTTLNDRAIGDFLLFGYNFDATTTTFSDIHRIPAAHCLTWSCGSVQVRRYWTLPIPEQVQYRRRSDYIGRFRELLLTAVKDRLRTDRIGIAMSGGLDSPAVAATALELLKETGRPFDLRAITVVYDRIIPDRERHYAGLVAKKLKIPIHFLAADDYQLYDRSAHPALQRPEPVHNPELALWVDELQYFSAHSRVALTGWDGDTILNESPKPYLRFLLNERNIGKFTSCLLWLVRNRPRLLQRSLIVRLKRIVHLPAVQKTPNYPIWLNKTFEREFCLKARWAEFNAAEQPLHPTRPDAVSVLTTPDLWQDLFEGNDPGASLFPLEFRQPFLDLRLVDFCLSIPPVPWCVSKELLRNAMRDILPKRVSRRPKEPLAGHPYLKMLQQPSATWLDDFHSAPELARYVDQQRIPKVAGETCPHRAWVNLQPYSLNTWLLHSVQTKHSFRE